MSNNNNYLTGKCFGTLSSKQKRFLLFLMFFIVNLINQATKKILVLSSYQGWKPVMLVNSAGDQEELTCFERDDTTRAHNSCFVNWKNQLFIFGGSTEQRQVSRLSGYKLERLGDLSFDHQYGACSNMANMYIFLCFDLKEDSNDTDDPRRCRRSTGPMEQFSEVALSNHVHRGIQTSCSDSKFISLCK